jgi:hypothetical protein
MKILDSFKSYTGLNIGFLLCLILYNTRVILYVRFMQRQKSRVISGKHIRTTRNKKSHSYHICLDFILLDRFFLVELENNDEIQTKQFGSRRMYGNLECEASILSSANA